MSHLTLNWYQQLVNDCSQLINEAKQQIVFKHWQIGKRILEDALKFEKPEYGSHTIASLADDLEVSKSTIWRELQFAKKYPELSHSVRELSWRQALQLVTGDGDKPHVAQNAGDSEWFTPSKYIEAARQVMGSIDTDPASTDKANEIVKATIYFTQQDDGRKQEWMGNIWLNPPYKQPLVSQFCNLLVSRYGNNGVKQACVLVNNATETMFYQEMLKVCSAVCFIKGRVKFLSSNGAEGAPLQGQTILYFGNRRKLFSESFGKFGVILYGK